MKNLKNILLAASLIFLTACTSTTAFEPHITQRLARTEIADLPPLSDFDKTGDILYFLVQTGDKVELKKRDFSTGQEDLVRIFPYNHEILKFALSADKMHIAFLGKEDDKFIVYITDLGGEHLINVEDAPAGNGNKQFDADSFILKRVGLKHKFLFVNLSYVDCGGEILSFVSHNVMVSCRKDTEIIPDEQLLVVEPDGEDKSILATTDYENWDPKKLLELPLKESDIQNIELLDEKTVRLTTDKEYVDVEFKN